MGIVGGRRGSARPRTAAAIALVAAVVGATLSGCAEEVDEARTVQTHVGRIHRVVDVAVAVPSPDRAAAITVTYAGAVTRAADLADLIGEIDDTADAHGYPAHGLTLVPATEPDSALVVEAGFRDSAQEDDALAAWVAVTAALLGPVTYDVRPDGETLTVASEGAAAHDVAEAQRIGHGDSRTTWAFRTGSSTFTVDGRVRPTDVTLFQAVQRNAGASGQPVWATAWQLDRRAAHVRLDLDLAFGTTLVAPGQLTLARYERTLGPMVRASLRALGETRLPIWLTLHSGSDPFASWASGEAPGKGRDPLDRGWDPWLAQEAAAFG